MKTNAKKKKTKITTKPPKEPTFELNEAKLTLFGPRRRCCSCWFTGEETCERTMEEKWFGTKL